MGSKSGGVTLLLAHGGGFCKEAWDPIARRLRASPLLAGRLLRCVTFDFPFHGTKRDEAETATLVFESPQSPRVRHRGNDWLEWSSAEAFAQVQALQRRSTETSTPLIGIGHSMGAAALWTTEVQHPGTFDGLVLFEPVTGVCEADGSKSIDFLVKLTLERQARWRSREAAMAYFDSLRNFAAWDREALQSYVRGAVVPDTAAGDTEWVLACSPLVEASFYCGKMLALSERELARPHCRTVFQSGERSQLFQREYFEALAARLPHAYALGRPIPKGSHLMVLEDPSAAAARILEALAQFPPFNGLDSASGDSVHDRAAAEAKTRL